MNCSGKIMGCKIRRCVVYVVLSLLSVGDANAQFPAVSVELLETGQPSVWSVEIFGRGVDFANMVTADGTVLEPQPWGGIRHTEDFDDHEAALAFLHGEWTTTETLGRNSAPLDRQFTILPFAILPFAIDELNRSFPVVSSPTPNFEAKNGEPFLLAWDFETANGEEAPDRSVVIRQRSTPEELDFSRVHRLETSGGVWLVTVGRARLQYKIGTRRRRYNIPARTHGNQRRATAASFRNPSGILF